jgi:hypothetical protein
MKDVTEASPPRKARLARLFYALETVLTMWLLAKGVNVERWRAEARRQPPS